MTINKKVQGAGIGGGNAKPVGWGAAADGPVVLAAGCAAPGRRPSVWAGFLKAGEL